LALQKVEIKQANFQEVLNYATGTNDFVYFDPPYYPLNKTSNFTAYSNFCFDENQQIKLRDIFIELADKGVKVMLSNSDCPLIRDLYSDFNVHTISAARSINSNAQKRGKIFNANLLNIFMKMLGLLASTQPTGWNLIIFGFSMTVTNRPC
jgi:DNA adenine methylase